MSPMVYCVTEGEEEESIKKWAKMVKVHFEQGCFDITSLYPVLAPVRNCG